MTTPFTTTLTSTRATAPSTSTIAKKNSICTIDLGYNYPQGDIAYMSNVTALDCCNSCGANPSCYGFSYMTDVKFCFLKGNSFQFGKREAYSSIISGFISVR